MSAETVDAELAEAPPSSSAGCAPRARWAKCLATASTPRISAAAPSFTEAASARTTPIWKEAARHFDERALAGLVLSIATINVWNRLNVATRQPAGVWKP